MACRARGHFPAADTANIVAVEQAQPASSPLTARLSRKIEQQGPGLDVKSRFFFHIHPSDHGHAQAPCLSAARIITTPRSLFSRSSQQGGQRLSPVAVAGPVAHGNDIGPQLREKIAVALQVLMQGGDQRRRAFRRPSCCSASRSSRRLCSRKNSAMKKNTASSPRKQRISKEPSATSWSPWCR